MIYHNVVKAYLQLKMIFHQVLLFYVFLTNLFHPFYGFSEKTWPAGLESYCSCVRLTLGGAVPLLRLSTHAQTSFQPR